jgi:hypothetical protein
MPISIGDVLIWSRFRGILYLVICCDILTENNAFYVVSCTLYTSSSNEFLNKIILVEGVHINDGWSILIKND